MKKKTSLLMSYVLIAVILTASCSEINDNGLADNHNNEEKNSIITNMIIPDIEPRPIYDIPVREKTEEQFPQLRNISSIASSYGTGVYVYGTVEGATSEKRFYFCNFEDGSVTPMFTLPKGFTLYYFQAMSDGTLLAGGTSGNEESFQIYQLSESSYSLIIQGPEKMLFGAFNCFVVDEQNGRVFINGYYGKSEIFEYTLSGELVNRYVSEKMIRDIAYSKKTNQLYAINISEDDLIVQAVGSEGKDFVDIASFKDGATGMMIHQSTTHELYAEKDLVIYGLDHNTNTFAEVFDFTKSGLSGWISYIFLYNGNYYSNIYETSLGKMSLVKLTITDDYDGPVQHLRFAKFEGGRDFYIEAAIADFNFYNPQYYIEIVDYSTHQNEAMTKLNLDIITGNAPDIFLLSEPLFQDNYLPVYQYIMNGILLDLAPYMARDLNYDNFIKTVLDSLYIGSSCYYAVTSFTLNTIVGSSEAIDSLIALDMIGFLEFLTEDLQGMDKNFAINMTNEEFAEFLITSYLNTFVNYRTGEINFESEEFIKLLESVLKLNTDEIFDVFLLANNKRKYAITNVSHFADLGRYASALHGDFNTSGFPGASTGVALMPKHIFGISAASNNKEGAWAFIRELYENESAHRVLPLCFPVNKVSYTTFLNEYKTILSEHYTEEATMVFIDSDPVLTLKDVTYEQIDNIVEQIEKLISNVDRVYIPDYNLLNIINEELPALIQGRRSAIDTARIIQDRTQKYVWETR